MWLCGTVCVSVCWTQLSLAKTSELIEMTFGVHVRMGPRYHVLDAGLNPSKRGTFQGAQASNTLWTMNASGLCARWLQPTACHGDAGCHHHYYSNLFYKDVTLK